MPGTNTGGDDPLAPTGISERGSADEPIAAPLTPPISGADQHEWNRYWDKLLRLMERVWFCFDWPLIPKELSQTPLNGKELLPRGWEWRDGESGIVCPVAPLPDPNEPATVIIRFMNYSKETINGRPVRPGTVAEIDFLVAAKLIGFGAVEFAKIDELRAYEALMLQVDQCERVTAQDPLSQQLGTVSPETPKLILRFVRSGIPVCEGKYSNRGEVWPVEKELAVRHLLEKEPMVELATPEELKRDRDIIDHSEEQSKSQVEATRIHRFKSGIPHTGPSTLIVRLLTPGRFAIHMKQGIVYEKQAEGCESLPCAAGEIWEVEQEFAYRLLRGKSPIGTLATDAEWEAYWAILIGEPLSVESAGQVQSGKGSKTVKTKRSTGGSKSRTDFITILTKYHRYSEDSGLRLEPISGAELSRQSGFVESTVSAFFKKEFGGHAKYKQHCRESSSLILALQALRGEISPHKLLRGGGLSSVPNRDEREDD